MDIYPFPNFCDVSIGQCIKTIASEIISDPTRVTYLQRIPVATLDELMAFLEITGEDKIIAILSEIYAIGLETLLNDVPAQVLQRFAENSNLIVESTSRETLKTALMTRQEYRKGQSKKSPAKAQTSTEKPEIKKGISSADLNAWFRRDELLDYCTSNNLPVRGSKKDLIKNILKFHEGNYTPKSTKTMHAGGRRSITPSKVVAQETPTSSKKRKIDSTSEPNSPTAPKKQKQEVEKIEVTDGNDHLNDISANMETDGANTVQTPEIVDNDATSHETDGTKPQLVTHDNLVEELTHIENCIDNTIENANDVLVESSIDRAHVYFPVADNLDEGQI